MGLVSYFAGVATGWAVRGTVDGSRGLAVSAMAAAYAAADQMKRWGAIEGEYIEDLLAEAKARYEQDKVRREEATTHDHDDDHDDDDVGHEPASRGFVQ